MAEEKPVVRSWVLVMCVIGLIAGIGYSMHLRRTAKKLPQGVPSDWPEAPTGDATLSGTITLNGEPLSGLKVRVRYPEMRHKKVPSVDTSAEGKFGFVNLSEKPKEVSWNYSSHGKTRTIRMRRQLATGVTEADMAITATGGIKITLEMPDGRPSSEGRRIYIRNSDKDENGEAVDLIWNSNLEVSEDGTIEMSDMPAGLYTITSSAIMEPLGPDSMGPMGYPRPPKVLEPPLFVDPLKLTVTDGETVEITVRCDEPAPEESEEPEEPEGSEQPGEPSESP